MARGLPRAIGVPKTIDNDLLGTDVTFRFETAVATATDALDKLHTTAQAHRRVIVVEVMGPLRGLDRVLAQRLGAAATRYLEETTESGLVAMVGGSTRLVPFSQVMGGTRNVMPRNELVVTARSLGSAFGDEPPGTFSRKRDVPPVSGVATRAEPMPVVVDKPA